MRELYSSVEEAMENKTGKKLWAVMFSRGGIILWYWI